MPLDPKLITPEQAYERLKTLQADLEYQLLVAPDPSDGPEAMEEHEKHLYLLRAQISLLSNFAHDTPPDLSQPF